MPAKSSKPSKKNPSTKQELPKTPPVEAAPAPKKTPGILKKKSREIPPEKHHRMIAEAAYFIAERHGFSDGRHERDWYEAEKIISQSLD